MFPVDAEEGELDLRLALGLNQIGDGALVVLRRGGDSDQSLVGLVDRLALVTQRGCGGVQDGEDLVLLLIGEFQTHEKGRRAILETAAKPSHTRSGRSHERRRRRPTVKFRVAVAGVMRVRVGHRGGPGGR